MSGRLRGPGHCPRIRQWVFRRRDRGDGRTAGKAPSPCNRPDLHENTRRRIDPIENEYTTINDQYLRKIHFVGNQIILHTDGILCGTTAEVLGSRAFQAVLNNFLDHLIEKEDAILTGLAPDIGTTEGRSNLMALLRHLSETPLVHAAKTVPGARPYAGNPRPESALRVFRDGAAMAEGTTTATGLGHSYFANISGPSQYRDLHEKLAERTFEAAFRAGIFVGQLRTRLALPGFGMDGPAEAAGALLRKIVEGPHV